MPHKDRRGIAERTAADLRAEIMSGELAPGDKIPTTEDLMARYSTSSMTIQRALAILKEEDLLEGRPGSGVFVRDRSLQTIHPVDYMNASERGAPYLWISEATKRNQDGGSRILRVAEVKPPKRVSARLEIEPDEKAVLRTRLGLLDGEPAEMTHSYYPASIARGTRLADRRKIPGGSPTLLKELGYPPRGQYDQVSAREATSEEYVVLELPRNIPVIEVFRVVYSDNERPIEVTVMVKPGHLFRMGYHLSVE